MYEGEGFYFSNLSHLTLEVILVFFAADSDISGAKMLKKKEILFVQFLMFHEGSM